MAGAGTIDRKPAGDWRAAAIVLLALALLLGAFLRCFHLGASELTPDEAASWAAAAAPTVARVIHKSAILNPGKLAAYDLMLHGWIAAFGSTVLTMRALSVLLGLAAIVLVFWVGRELLRLGGGGEQSDGAIDYAAALAALIFAVSLISVRYTREARMYPLLMAALLAETGFFLRAHRRGGFFNYAAVAAFTALSIATNFTAVFVFAAQGLWLLMSREGRRRGLPWRPAAALGAGVAVLMPAMIGGAVHNSVAAMDKGALSWISPPPPWGPVSLFNRATGTLPFPVLLGFALWAVYSQWHRLRAAIVFALFWMWAPVLLLYLLSVTLTPLLVERYALSCFVPFMLLTAIGIRELTSARMRMGAVALAVVVSIGHVAGFLARPPSRQWTHAIERIRDYSLTATIAVAPPYGANVIRYYLPPEGRYVVTGLNSDSCAESQVLFLWDHAMSGPSHDEVAQCRRGFPRDLFAEKDVLVMVR